MTDWIDGQGRQIDYLRLSVTDRCDFRCVYCMAEDMRFLPRQQVLTLEEIERVARLFVAGGVRKGSRWCGPASSACASAWRHCRGCANCA